METRFKFKYTFRVRHDEIDTEGLALCASYFKYMNIGLTEYLRNLKFSYPQNWHYNFYYMPISANCSVKNPAHFDDELVVYTKISSVEKESFSSVFELYGTAGYKLVAQGNITSAALNPKKWEQVELPSFFSDAIKKFESKTHS